MKNIIAAVMLGLASISLAQVPATSTPPAAPEVETASPKAPYDSSKAKLAVQTMKTDALQYQSLDLSKAIAAAVQQFQQQQQVVANDFTAQQKAISDFQDSVRKSNGWDSSYIWDADKDTWSHPKTPTKK